MEVQQNTSNAQVQQPQVKMTSENIFYNLETLYETKYAELSNGERLGYREAGDGITVLLLHGNFTCSQVMEPLMSKLSSHLKCVAPCMRGFGYSSYNTEMTSLKDLA